MAQLFLQKAKQFVVDNKERPFFFIMACISRMCLEYLMNVLLASRVWGLAEMLFSKLIGVLMSFERTGPVGTGRKYDCNIDER